MTKAFCPGHISCFFSPVRTAEAVTTGSVGAGIRLNKGCFVTLEERSDKKIRVTMDGVRVNARITEHTIRSLAPDRGFDVTVENELPVSQGMGMSAAGAAAAGLCAASVTGLEEYEAYKAAHTAEVTLGGGLGDVAGILGGRQPIRVKAGIQPYGRVIDSELDMNITVAVLGPKMDTNTVLSDPAAVSRIAAAGLRCVDEFINTQTEKKLFGLSAEFSESAGLETKEVKDALAVLRKDHAASMCMLGNSIFTNASEDEVQDLLGNVVSFSCSSSAEGPKLIRKA